jgi:hypothetical protein
MTAQPITEAQARAAKARCEAATKGPWTTEKPGICDETGFASGVIVAATGRGSCVYAHPPGGSFPAFDRTFIAHAREDLPAALARIEQQDEWIDKAIPLLERYRDDMRACAYRRSIGRESGSPEVAHEEAAACDALLPPEAP